MVCTGSILLDLPVVDLTTGALKVKLDLGLKTATALQFMHTRDQICVGHQDGSVTVFNLRGECVTNCEPPPGIVEPVTSITTREVKNLLVASTTNHLVQWILTERDSKNPAYVYAFQLLSYLPN